MSNMVVGQKGFVFICPCYVRLESIPLCSSWMSNNNNSYSAQISRRVPEAKHRYMYHQKGIYAGEEGTREERATAVASEERAADCADLRILEDGLQAARGDLLRRRRPDGCDSGTIIPLYCYWSPSFCLSPLIFASANSPESLNGKIFKVT